jgi:hypothetical protein
MINVARLLWMLTALATTLVACVAEDEENVCTRAASLCGAAKEVQDDRCVGAPKDYAACLVQSGDCSTTAKVECAGAAVDGGGWDGSTTAFPDSSCSFGAEDTPAACSDGCSNDGDSFVDCNDFDCCDVVDCPSDSVCGKKNQCQPGPENTVSACSDGCSNDDDNYVDCDDYDCCDVVSCPATSACGSH